MAKTDLAQLKQTQLRALVVLMVQARPLTNRDLRELAGTDLSSGRGEHLRTLGLVTVEKVGRTNYYTLDDRGWRALREPYAAGPLDAVGRFVFTLLSGLQTGLEQRGISLGDLFQPGPEEAVDEAVSVTVADVIKRIRVAYAARPKAPGGWVGLAELRADLGDLSRDDIDAALRQLAREKGVRLAPFDNIRSLRPQDKVAALQLGDSPKHMIAMGQA